MNRTFERRDGLEVQFLNVASEMSDLLSNEHTGDLLLSICNETDDYLILT